MNRHGAPVRALLPLLLAAKIAVSPEPACAQATRPLTVSADFWGEVASGPGARARSFVVGRAEAPIFRDPSRESARRGTAEAQARLPIFGARTGGGCAGRWLLVAPEAYVCEDTGTLESMEAPSLAARASRAHDGLPYRYFFVQREGAFGYDALASAEEGVPNAQLQPGFGIAVRRIAEKNQGDPFGLTTRGFWVPLRDLTAVPPVSFHGSPFSPSLAWIVSERAPLFSAPGRRKPGPGLERLTTVNVLERVYLRGWRYLRIGEHDYLRDQDVRWPELSPPPAEARPGERWLDVDLARQTLVAYIGHTPVFATLVSTGRGAVGTETATPPGVYRVWVKLRSSDMDNLEDTEARENYAIEAVPWVMFFQRGYGLHGTFWHKRFGETHSHGCVNLSPIDAEYLFFFSGPRLYPGWSAALPAPHELGTLVRIR